MAYYNLARNAYREGHPDAADLMLEKVRALGFAGHYGSLGHRAASSLIGLKRKEMLASLIRRWRRQDRGGSTSINIADPF